MIINSCYRDSSRLVSYNGISQIIGNIPTISAVIRTVDVSEINYNNAYVKQSYGGASYVEIERVLTVGNALPPLVLNNAYDNPMNIRALPGNADTCVKVGSALCVCQKDILWIWSTNSAPNRGDCVGTSGLAFKFASLSNPRN